MRNPYPATTRTRDLPEHAEGRSAARIPTTQIPRTRKAPELTDFQDLVSSSVGKVLPIYGESLFENVPTTFAPVEHIPVTSDYVIGPGDELLIRGWGQLSLNVRTRVDRNGNIFIPQVGNFYVAGVKYEQLQPFLKAQVGRVFQNFDLSVTSGRTAFHRRICCGPGTTPGSLYRQFAEHHDERNIRIGRSVADRLDAANTVETRLRNCDGV